LPISDDEYRESDLRRPAERAPRLGMELNVAIIVVIGVVLAIGIAVFVKYLVDL
jgi:hypothetical protein